MIKKITTYITPFQLERTLHIALPDNYYETQVHYPVMYMYDGHNLFQDHDATYGKSWGLEDFLNDYDKPFIIVGIECNHEGQERLNEFTPYTFDNSYFGHINGKGEILMDWVIEELKPFIEQLNNSKPEPAYTCWSEVEPVIYSYLQSAVSGDITPKEACSKMAKDINAMIGM